MNATQFRTNSQIKSPQVRLLREDGSQVGVVTLHEALSQAKMAHVDLVEIAPTANPPVVKLIDYKKFLYQLSKKERAAKANAKKVELKEVRLTPFMADNDFQIRVNRAKQFLASGHKVRISVKFAGRQLSHKEFGQQLFDKTASALAGISVIDQAPKWVGKQFTGSLTPLKNSQKNVSQASSNSHEAKN